MNCTLRKFKLSSTFWFCNAAGMSPVFGRSYRRFSFCRGISFPVFSLDGVFLITSTNRNGIVDLLSLNKRRSGSRVDHAPTTNTENLTTIRILPPNSNNFVVHRRIVAYERDYRTQDCKSQLISKSSINGRSSIFRKTNR